MFYEAKLIYSESDIKAKWQPIANRPDTILSTPNGLWKVITRELIEHNERRIKQFCLHIDNTSPKLLTQRTVEYIDTRNTLEDTRLTKIVNNTLKTSPQPSDINARVANVATNLLTTTRQQTPLSKVLQIGTNIGLFTLSSESAKQFMLNPPLQH